jgi:hypothetical protein
VKQLLTFADRRNIAVERRVSPKVRALAMQMYEALFIIKAKSLDFSGNRVSLILPHIPSM